MSDVACFLKKLLILGLNFYTKSIEYIHFSLVSPFCSNDIQQYVTFSLLIIQFGSFCIIFAIKTFFFFLNFYIKKNLLDLDASILIFFCFSVAPWLVGILINLVERNIQYLKQLQDVFIIEQFFPLPVWDQITILCVRFLRTEM